MMLWWVLFSSSFFVHLLHYLLNLFEILFCFFRCIQLFERVLSLDGIVQTLPATTARVWCVCLSKDDSLLLSAPSKCWIHGLVNGDLGAKRRVKNASEVDQSLAPRSPFTRPWILSIFHCVNERTHAVVAGRICVLLFRQGAAPVTLK